MRYLELAVKIGLTSISMLEQGCRTDKAMHHVCCLSPFCQVFVHARMQRKGEPRDTTYLKVEQQNIVSLGDPENDEDLLGCGRSDATALKYVVG